MDAIKQENNAFHQSQWSGHSTSTAMKTYALVKKCDFEDVGMAEKVDTKCDAKCDAISAVDAKSDAESASTTEQKKSTVENSNSLPCISVGDLGLQLPYRYPVKTQRTPKGHHLGYV